VIILSKAIIQNYYCIVSNKKWHDYKLLIKPGTNNNHVAAELIREGYLVLRCLNTASLLKLQQITDYSAYRKIKPNSKWSERAFVFMKTIQLLDEDK
jgi:hypothetical protein